jgi:hypothetical protein
LPLRSVSGVSPKSPSGGVRIAVLLIAFITFALLSHAPSWGASAQREQLWLAVSDIHLNAFDPSVRPSSYGFDANRALFESAVVEMKRAAPSPTLVLLPGDLLMHDFARQVRHIGITPDEAGIQTMRWIAATLERAFPNAQFAIAVGNNDIPCGDYKSGDDGPYLAAVARIWAPLVNRHGASREFVASFARSGYYTARLPLPGLRLAVLNTVLLSSQYRGNCGRSHFHAAADQLTWLSRTLRGTPPGVRNVVMMHIPPGYDAFSTEYLHEILAWPFLKRRYTAELVNALGAPRNGVAYGIAGHTHRFDFRIAGGVPIIVLGSLSPIYDNNPAFFVLHVLPTGELRDIDTHVFDEPTQAWPNYRSFDETWRTQRVDATSLERLHAEFAKLPALRARWDQQASGWPGDLIDTGGEWRRTWRVAWCAQLLSAGDFAQCAGIQARERILPVFGSIVIVCVLFLALTLIVRVRAAPRG